MQLSDAAAAVEGQLLGDDGRFAGVSSDSRAVVAGSLFVALRGDRFDAHDFADQAVAAGAAALMVERSLELPLPQLLVADCRLALGKLAAHWRTELAPALVAVTGSNGKTSVKEMVAAILRRVGPTHATKGNFNNDLGVPFTLLALAPEQRFAVVEMGANHPSEIAYLCSLAEPDVALVNNVAAAHLEGFGSLEGVARAKGEIFSGLAADGTALINLDEPYAPLWRQLAGERRQIGFGFHPEAEMRGVWQAPNRLQLHWQGEQVNIELPLLGEHNGRNGVAAAAAGVALGLNLEQVAAGLSRVEPVKGRLQPKSGLNGCRLLDDTYNANPASLAAGLEVLIAQGGESWLILGDMFELGETREQLHFELGEMARRMGVQHFLALGELSRHSCAGFGAGAEHFESREAMARRLQQSLTADSVVLIKGSRAMQLDKLVSLLEAPSVSVQTPASGGGDASLPR